MNPIELISSQTWERASFTTYALSLSFFEAVVLDALVRGHSNSIVIMSDVEGVRGALGEYGARRVGRDYELEPIAVHGGVFHPKITSLISDNDSHLLIGSGNLTFGGWGANLEIYEHLHPSFAATAFNDTADFFELLAISDRIKHNAEKECEATANALRKAARSGNSSDAFRVFHNLDNPISNKIIEATDELGGATRLTVVSPFWDNGQAIDRICAALGLDQVFVHSHRNIVGGGSTLNWPSRPKTNITAVKLNWLNENSTRQLHAKAYEIICKRGRILISGSANATYAALEAKHNVEACVARIYREKLSGWTFEYSNPPLVIEEAANPLDDENSRKIGILRAELQGDILSGSIISPPIHGSAIFSIIIDDHIISLGEFEINSKCNFRLEVKSLEAQALHSSRLLLRIECGKSVVEGFISLAGLTAMFRRAGTIGPKLLALLAGTETPLDVVAILEWFMDNSSRLSIERKSKHNIARAIDDSSDVSTLIPTSALTISNADAHNLSSYSQTNSTAAWARFLDYISLGLREHRDRFENSDIEENQSEEGSDKKQIKDYTTDTTAPVLKNFSKLFDSLLASDSSQAALLAYDLTHYICSRFTPDYVQTRLWLIKLMEAITKHSVDPERRDEFVSVVIALVNCLHDPIDVRRGRDWIIKLSYNFADGIPTPSTANVFFKLLQQATEISIAWEKLRSVRTAQELIRLYLNALGGDIDKSALDELSGMIPEEWPRLKNALEKSDGRRNIVMTKPDYNICPKCFIKLPSGEASKLRQFRCATAKNCCNRILIAKDN